MFIKKLVLSCFVLITLCYIYGCSKESEPDTEIDLSRISVDDWWQYTITEKRYVNSSLFQSTVDTLTLYVKGLENDWYTVSYRMSFDDTASILYQPRNDGLYVSGLSLLAGKFPIFRSSVENSNDTILLYPYNESVTSWKNGDITYTFVKDSLYVWNDTSFQSSFVSISAFMEPADYLLYNDTVGVLKKTFSPDSIVYDGDTIIIHKEIELFQYNISSGK